jgi:prevent-host-death family protein
MKKILISDFKAKCIAIINEINQTKESVIITRRGEPVARVEPYSGETPHRKLGGMKMMKISGDIIHSGFEDEWDINT